MTHPLCYHAMDFYLNGLLSAALSTASKKWLCLGETLHSICIGGLSSFRSNQKGQVEMLKKTS